MLLAHAREKFFHLRRVRVIDLNRYATAAAARDFIRRVLDCPGRMIDRFGSGARRAAGNVDSSARIAQREGDAASTTSAGSGHDSDFTVQVRLHLSSI